jgi:hypothetical protein
MAKAEILLHRKFAVSERYLVEITLLKVEPSEKYPEGINASFVLIDAKIRLPRLLIDNHAPWGFHVHEELPHKKDSRRSIHASNYMEAQEEFFRLMKEILKDEN